MTTYLKRQRSTTSPPIVSKITRIKKENDFCSNIAVIPQFSGTCWFNAILMAAFYSQQSRLLFKFTSKSWTPETITDSKKYKLLMIFKSIVFKYYKNQREAIEFYKKIKPEFVLLYLLQLNKTKNNYKKLLTRVKEKHNLGWNIDYIVDFYQFLGIKYLDIIIADNNLYYNLRNDLRNGGQNTKASDDIKTTIDANPDVLFIVKYDDFEKHINNKQKKYNPYLSTNFSYENDFNINDVKDEITFNGYKYKLDSCLLSNHNKDAGSHSVVGITCLNTRYVYNGWNINTNDKGIKETIVKSNPCSLFKYDWNSKTTVSDFCFNTNECKLSSKIKPKDLCFSFFNGDKIYVYVKTVSTLSRNSSKVNTENLFLTPSNNITSAIKSIYSIDKLDTKDKLLLQLEKLYNSDNSDNVKININYLNLKDLTFVELKDIYMDYIKNTYKRQIKKINKIKYALVIKTVKDLILRFIELYEVDDENKADLLLIVSDIKDNIISNNNKSIYDFLYTIKSESIEELVNETNETILKEKKAFIKEFEEKIAMFLISN
jgi:hypothetical protein